MELYKIQTATSGNMLTWKYIKQNETLKYLRFIKS